MSPKAGVRWAEGAEGGKNQQKKNYVQKSIHIYNFYDQVLRFLILCLPRKKIFLNIKIFRFNCRNDILINIQFILFNVIPLEENLDTSQNETWPQRIRLIDCPLDFKNMTISGFNNFYPEIINFIYFFVCFKNHASLHPYSFWPILANSMVLILDGISEEVAHA